jgi:ubiquinone/menaquinone biosynthesis C-methylase UbiE
MSTNTSEPDSTSSTGAILPVPNHHADHGGFSGLGGLVAAVGFLSGRDAAARLAIELAELQAGERVVDVGCGPGIAVQQARKLGADVVGVDPATVMLRVARFRWRRAANVSWRIGTAESIPVDDGWANVVWSLATVHHWVDIEAGIGEARRVLAPGGRLVVIERRIADTSAEGVASHGWTVEQSESFAEHCRRHGFVDVATGIRAGDRDLLHVVAHW